MINTVCWCRLPRQARLMPCTRRGTHRLSFRKAVVRAACLHSGVNIRLPGHVEEYHTTLFLMHAVPVLATGYCVSPCKPIPEDGIKVEMFTCPIVDADCSAFEQCDVQGNVLF